MQTVVVRGVGKIGVECVRVWKTSSLPLQLSPPSPPALVPLSSHTSHTSLHTRDSTPPTCGFSSSFPSLPFFFDALGIAPGMNDRRDSAITYTLFLTGSLTCGWIESRLRLRRMFLAVGEERRVAGSRSQTRGVNGSVTQQSHTPCY